MTEARAGGCEVSAKSGSLSESAARATNEQPPPGAAVASATVEPVPVVEELLECSNDSLSAIERLVTQLSRSAAPPTRARLAEIISSPACQLLVSRDAGGNVVGMLTLVLFPIPTGIRAWIEDVVVDHSARGQGVGARLVREAVARARLAGARTVDLTSRPDREAANALYVREGFKLRESNVYRVTL